MYEEIDKILAPWLKKYGLQVHKEYKEAEVRSLYVVDDLGEFYQIWVIPIDGAVEIKYGARTPKKYNQIATTYENLEKSLDTAYDEILSWIKERGHTRTPVL